jgi:hypothetical protein
MSKDHLINLFIEPDLDSDTISFSTHRSNISRTDIVKEDPDPFPPGRTREKFEKVKVKKRGSTEKPRILWRRVPDNTPVTPRVLRKNN